MAQRNELDELQEIARQATYDALKEYEPLPTEWRTNLALGACINENYGVFEMYVAAERPEDTKVISVTRVHRQTRQVEVTISNLTKIF
jgi:hypothetical protein